MAKKKMITVYGEILQETEKAILVRCDAESDGAWLSKSQIKYEGERGDTGVEIQIPAMLAEEKGFFDGMGRAQVKASSVPAEPEQPKTVTFYGVRNYEEDAEDAICFDVHYNDGRDTSTNLFIPKAYIVSEGKDSSCPDEEGRRYIEISVAHAIELDLLEEIDIEHGASTVPNDRHFLREETITVCQELTQKEQAEYAEEMAALDGEIQELEDERDHVSKSLKKQIDSKEDKRRALSKIVREGKEQREITCDLTADYNTCEMVWTDTYQPHEEVQRRKMTEEERQLPLEMQPKPEAPAQDDDPESPARSCATCAHIDTLPAEGEDAPCADCGGDDLPNWLGRDAESSIPGGPEIAPADAAEVV